MHKLPRPSLSEFRDSPDDARVRLNTLIVVTALSKSTVWRRVKNDPSFPKPFKDGGATVWRVGDVRRYLAAAR